MHLGNSKDKGSGKSHGHLGDWPLKSQCTSSQPNLFLLSHLLLWSSTSRSLVWQDCHFTAVEIWGISIREDWCATDNKRLDLHSEMSHRQLAWTAMMNSIKVDNFACYFTDIFLRIVTVACKQHLDNIYVLINHVPCPVLTHVMAHSRATGKPLSVRLHKRADLVAPVVKLPSNNIHTL